MIPARWLAMIPTRWLGLVILGAMGCSGGATETHEREDAQVLRLCNAGRFQEAVRALPGAMEAWAQYEAETGSTAEGAAGYLYSSTLSSVARKGDAEWGRIFDDPQIPHELKIEMVFEILEHRLGKGAAWAPYHTDVVILPKSPDVSSWAEVNALLERALSAGE